MFWSFNFIVILCAVDVYSYNFHIGYCEGCRNDYTRLKRAKYYTNQPMKLYNRSPFSPPTRGPSYTTQTGYNSNYIGPPFASHLRPYKVSKRPTYKGLGDEDTNNLFQYLSKNDLDKIVENTIGRERLRDMDDKDNIYMSNSNFVNKDIVPYNYDNYENSRILNSLNVNKYNNFDYGGTNYNNQITGIQNSQPHYQTPPEIDPFRNDEQFSSLDAYIMREIEGTSPDKNNIYTDSRTMQEEQLPNPTNLRNDHYEISYTNEVPSVIKPETSYKLENFADLPLMNYENSKLHMVDSYNVPHYSVTSSIHKPLKSASSFSSSVTSSSHLISPSSSRINVPEVEPAPPVSSAKEQSDAHLKATKIWTHKSKGTAYYLHDDGTLTLEKPTRPKFKSN